MTRLTLAQYRIRENTRAATTAEKAAYWSMRTKGEDLCAERAVIEDKFLARLIR